jgi:polyisoprenoid-binding protein YceI
VEPGDDRRWDETAVIPIGLEMWDALKARDHDAVSFRMERYQLGGPSGPGVTIELQGELTIAGTPRAVTLELRATELPDGGLRVEGSTGFPMTDFGVRPPRLMLGTLRVHDPVTVGFDLVLTSDSGAR